MRIRSRLTLQFIIITAAIFLIALYFIFKQFEAHITNEHFNLLESKALMTAEMVLRDEEKLKPIISSHSSESEVVLPNTSNTAIYNDRFECVFKLNPRWPGVDQHILTQIKQSGNVRFSELGVQAVGISTNSNKNNEFYVVSSDSADLSNLKKLRNILLLSFLIVMLAVAAGGWFFAKQSLSPVENIISDVEKIIPSNLNSRLIPSNQGDELAHLVTTFNNLLQRIEEAFKLQRSFISNVSHEIKNPIAAIDAQIQVAKTKFKDHPDTSKLLESLHEDIIEINETNDKLLQLSKFYSDKSSVNFKPVRIDELIFNCIDDITSRDKNNKVNVDFIQMPEDEELLKIVGNDFLLQTAFFNLMENACKFSHNRLVKICLDFSKPDHIEIEFYNSSDLISTDEMNKIFEPFYRAKTHYDIKGSGLGLSIVKSIFDLHHFQIFCRLDKKEGNLSEICFTVSIPKIKN